MRCIWTSYDYVSGKENAKKFDEMVVGGVIHCRIFKYPEQPKTVLKWKIRKVNSDEDAL